MNKGLLRKLCRAFYLQDSLPDTISIPATGEGQQAIEKPIEEATLDDIAFAAQALDKETDVLYSRLSVLRRLYREARAKGGLGSDNILDALSKKGGRHE